MLLKRTLRRLLMQLLLPLLAKPRLILILS
nr:MAG TPA: hypothetical protein [Caudoviricetes sp.]DAU62737.1 MAG TPA: hypothetical protein [Caudoviricetes sp.]